MGPFGHRNVIAARSTALLLVFLLAAASPFLTIFFTRQTCRPEWVNVAMPASGSDSKRRTQRTLKSMSALELDNCFRTLNLPIGGANGNVTRKLSAANFVNLVPNPKLGEFHTFLRYVHHGPFQNMNYAEWFIVSART